jgi:hypothetical protein
LPRLVRVTTFLINVKFVLMPMPLRFGLNEQKLHANLKKLRLLKQEKTKNETQKREDHLRVVFFLSLRLGFFISLRDFYHSYKLFLLISDLL